MPERERENNPGYTIRRAEPDDIDAIQAFMIGIFENDFGYGYRPEFHQDVDKMREVYLDAPHHILLVAVDDATGAIAGTGGVRSGGLKPEFNHRWLVERYDPERTAQLVRVYTAAEQRGRGIARAIVADLLQFVAETERYQVVALHTDPRSPGAERFWRSMPTTLILDDRDGPSGSLHFEMEIPRGNAPGSAREVATR